jgi:hypothetical protein
MMIYFIAFAAMLRRKCAPSNSNYRFLIILGWLQVRKGIFRVNSSAASDTAPPFSKSQSAFANGGTAFPKS